MPLISRRTAFTSAGLAKLGSSLAAETKVPAGNDHCLNVRDFGAKADQTTDDTAAFQAAIRISDKSRSRRNWRITFAMQ